MSLTLDQGDGYVDLIITDAPDVVNVFRLAQGGVREYLATGWETSGGSLLVRDAEIPHNVPTVYTVENVSGVELWSAWLEISNPSAWLKVPGRPNVMLETWVTNADPGWASKARAGVFEVIGSPFPLIVDDVRQAESLTIEIFTANRDEEAVLFDAVKSVVLFEPAPDDHHRDRGYYHVGDLSKAVQVPGSRGTVWSLPLQATLRPSVALTGHVGMWELITERWATWQDLVDEGFASWLDLIRAL